MGGFIYLLFFVLAIDLIRAAAFFTGISLPVNPWSRMVTGMTVVFFVLVILVYGTWNARNPRTVQYDVYLDAGTKGAEALTTIHAVLVSDIHLGTIVRNRHLEKLVDEINQLQPDLVLFAGDMIDENVNHFIDEQMDDTLRQLNPPLGKYAVLGNHEYFGGHLREIVDHLEAADIRVLRDEGVMIQDAIYLIGREDIVSQRFTGIARKSLESILGDVDPAITPVVVMDHQPKTWHEARDTGVALQVSGHTHGGQLFPFGWITRRLFEEDWGILREDTGTLIVSSGYGTWGPPIRTGNRPEIVLINLISGYRQ